MLLLFMFTIVAAAADAHLAAIGAALVAAVAAAATAFAAAVTAGLRGMFFGPASFCCCCYCRTPWDVVHVVAGVVEVVVVAVEAIVVELVTRVWNAPRFWSCYAVSAIAFPRCCRCCCCQ